MSEQNVEVLRRANEAVNHGDVEALLALCTDDVEVEDLHPAPDIPAVVRGQDGVGQLVAGWADAFDELSAEIEEYIDIDDVHVAAVTRYLGRQRTGLEVDFRGVDLWEIRDARLARGTIGYPNRQAALEAVAARR